jgi:hypothetical protein
VAVGGAGGIPNMATKRKKQPKLTKKILAGYAYLFGGKIPPGALEQIKKEYRANPGGPGAFERCVKAVAARGGAYSPRGVCATAGRKKYGAAKFKAMAIAGKKRAVRKRRNAAPVLVSFTADKHGRPIAYRDSRAAGAGRYIRIGYDKAKLMVATGKAEETRYAGPAAKANPRSPSAAKAKYKATARAKRTADPEQRARAWAKFGKRLFPKKKNPSRRRNGEEAAEERYKIFHGRPSDVVIDVTESKHVHSVLSGIGKLVKLEIEAIDGKSVVVLSGFKGTVLAQDEAGTQLYVKGGDQSVNLRDFGINHPHEFEILGAATRIFYDTQKDHLGDDGGKAVFDHKFGGRGSRLPMIEYDVRNKLLSFAGGGYTLPEVGISG